MKTKEKISKLVEMGLSPSTVGKLNENQIDVLLEKFAILEQGAVMMSAEKALSDPGKLKDLTSRGINVKVESEVSEDEEDPMDFEKGQRTQDPHQVGPSSDDGWDNYGDGMPTESVEEQEENNPWAICHAQLGPKKNAKFERCVRQVKKSLKEGKSPMDFFIEEQIVSLVENYLEPKMTKSEILDMISEQGVIRRSVYKPKSKKGKSIRMSRPIGDLGMLQSMGESETETAPVKPTTKPDTKPSIRPAHPGKKPFEGPNPRPKASKKEMETAKKDILQLIQNILRDGKKQKNPRTD